MQITVTIPDEVAAQAHSRGLTPENYVERLIAEQILIPHAAVRQRDLSLDEFDAALDALTRYSDRIPSG